MAVQTISPVNLYVIVNVQLHVIRNAKRGLFSSSLSSAFGNLLSFVSLKEQEQNSSEHVTSILQDVDERGQAFNTGCPAHVGNHLSFSKEGGAGPDYNMELLQVKIKENLKNFG